MTMIITTPLLDSGGVKYLAPEVFALSKNAGGAVNGTHLIAAYGINGDTCIAAADARAGFVEQPGSFRCHASNGQSNLYASQNPTGFTGPVVNGSADRMTRVADPDNAAKWAWRMRTDVADAQTFSGNRSEFSFDRVDARVYPNTRYIIGFQIRLMDISTVPTGDMMLVWQMHGAADISPWLALLINGSTITFNRASTSVVPPTNEARVDVPCTTVSLPANTWVRIVIELVWDHTGNIAQLRLLVNGTVAYTLPAGTPLGYNEAYSYLKTGVYKWTNSGNVWTTTGALGTREAYYKGPFMFQSPTGTAEEMDVILQDL